MTIVKGAYGDHERKVIKVVDLESFEKYIWICVLELEIGVWLY